jgi:hypothetical protein
MFYNYPPLAILAIDFALSVAAIVIWFTACKKEGVDKEEEIAAIKGKEKEF